MKRAGGRKRKTKLGGRPSPRSIGWLGGCEPRALGQSRYAGAAVPARTTQRSHTAAGPQGEAAVTSTCDVPSCKTKTSRQTCCPAPVFAATASLSTSPGRPCFQVRLDQFIVLPGACVRRNDMSEWSST
ncbi:hypothetical protein MTO96_028995 [Rhipicephalus appendiculatus]